LCINSGFTPDFHKDCSGGIVIGASHLILFSLDSPFNRDPDLLQPLLALRLLGRAESCMRMLLYEALSFRRLARTTSTSTLSKVDELRRDYFYRKKGSTLILDI
jgi:hypothetical protein